MKNEAIREKTVLPKSKLNMPKIIILAALIGVTAIFFAILGDIVKKELVNDTMSSLKIIFVLILVVLEVLTTYNFGRIILSGDSKK